MATDHANMSGLHLPWAGKSVRPEDTEDELTRLWHMAADNMRTSPNIHVRTSVLNFVICVLDLESAQRASMLMRDLSSTNIGRVILLILDTNSNAPSTVSTWVTLRSFPMASDIMRHHFEQITILATGSAIQASSHIIQPLLKPDLPIYLWWANDLPDDETIFSRLVSMSSRVIVDSSNFLLPEKQIRTLPSLLNASPTCAFSDLNWGRITPWRELIAQFFDALEYRPYLASINQIEIEHTVAPLVEPARTKLGEVSPNSLQALLLAAWLKTRLGWHMTENTSKDKHDAVIGLHTWYQVRSTGPLVLRTNSDRITGQLGERGMGNISIRPRVQTHLRPGSACFIRLSSSSGDRLATFTIHCEDDSDHVLTSVELEQGSRIQRIVHLKAMYKESELLHDELEIMGRDHLYEDTLHAIAEMLAEQLP